MRAIAEGLVYRDFITVGLLVDGLKISDPSGGLVKDNWIYIQEPDVKVGRLQIFNNWSPYLVADPTKVWIGLEYFCNEGDDLWSLSDDELKELGRVEMERIDIIDTGKVEDSVVIRVPKTYPAYFGTYDRFDTLREWLDRFENLFLIGRNGMHRYNNQDHSMLTAILAVDNIVEDGLTSPISGRSIRKRNTMKRRATDESLRGSSVAWRIAAIALGVGLCLVYWFLERGLPRGIAEFVYIPSLQFMPFAAMRGFTYEQLWRHGARLLLLGPGLLSMSWGLAALVPLRAPDRRQLARLTLVVCGVSVILSTFCSRASSKVGPSSTTN